jgi:hypothetical protein
MSRKLNEKVGEDPEAPAPLLLRLLPVFDFDERIELGLELDTA